MTKHPFNGSVDDRRNKGRRLHYEGLVSIITDRSNGHFHTSYNIHLHDGHGKKITEDKLVTVVGEFDTEQDALSAALEHAGKYFR